MSDLKELKRRIDIVDILKKIGARTRITDDWADEVQVWCPFCDDSVSHKPAASANMMKGLYFCYSCGFGGSIIDIAVRHLQDNASEDTVFGSYSTGISGAVEWLEENWPAPEDEDDSWTS